MKINSVRILKSCFMPFVILGSLVYSFMQIIPLNMSPFLRFIIKGSGFVIFYGVLVWLIINNNDRMFFKKVIKR